MLGDELRNRLLDCHEKPCMIMSVVYMLVVGGPVSCTAGGSHLVQVRPHINLKMIDARSSGLYCALNIGPGPFD